MNRKLRATTNEATNGKRKKKEKGSNENQ